MEIEDVHVHALNNEDHLMSLIMIQYYACMQVLLPHQSCNCHSLIVK